MSSAPSLQAPSLTFPSEGFRLVGLPVGSVRYTNWFVGKRIDLIIKKIGSVLAVASVQNAMHMLRYVLTVSAMYLVRFIEPLIAAPHLARLDRVVGRAVRALAWGHSGMPDEDTHFTRIVTLLTSLPMSKGGWGLHYLTDYAPLAFLSGTSSGLCTLDKVLPLSDPLRPVFAILLEASTVIPAFTSIIPSPILATSFGLAIIDAISVAYDKK